MVLRLIGNDTSEVRINWVIKELKVYQRVLVF